MDFNIFPSIVQFLITGLASGLAIFAANVALDWYRRPQLSFDKGGFSQGIRIHVPLFNLDNAEFEEIDKELKVSYLVTRATIENKTNNAAENCKGVLQKDNREEKLCWTVPKEKYTMTINSHSKEFLDVCAVLEDKQEEVYRRMQNSIAKLGNSGPANRAKQNLESIYTKAEDIPLIIAPTEDGWMPSYLNRIMTDGEATLLVTSKNAKFTLKLDIKILKERNIENKFIELK